MSPLFSWLEMKRRWRCCRRHSTIRFAALNQLHRTSLDFLDMFAYRNRKVYTEFSMLIGFHLLVKMWSSDRVFALYSNGSTWKQRFTYTLINWKLNRNPIKKDFDKNNEPEMKWLAPENCCWKQVSQKTVPSTTAVRWCLCLVLLLACEVERLWNVKPRKRTTIQTQDVLMFIMFCTPVKVQFSRSDTTIWILSL